MGIHQKCVQTTLAALSRAHSSPLPGIDCGGGQVRSFGPASLPSSSMRERPPKGEGGEPVPGEGTNEHRVGARGRNLGWGLQWNPHHNKGNKHRTPLQFARHGYAVDSQNYLSILLLDDTFHLRNPSTSYHFFEEGWPFNIIMQIGPQDAGKAYEGASVPQTSRPPPHLCSQPTRLLIILPSLPAPPWATSKFP